MSIIIKATIVGYDCIEKQYEIADTNEILSYCIRSELKKDGVDCFKTIDGENNERMLLSFPAYYDDPEMLFWNDMYPFIIKNGIVEWGVSYEDVTVSDFLETHGLKEDDEIEVTVNGGIGGDGGIAVLLAWLHALRPYLSAFNDYTAPLLFVISIAGLFKRRDGNLSDPRAVRCFFRKRKEWNTTELDNVAAVSDEKHAECIMEYSGFKRNKQGVYIKNEYDEESYYDMVANAEQEYWGRYIGRDGEYIEVAALAHDINRKMTEIICLTKELGSNEGHIARDLISKYVNKWPSYLKAGSKMQFVMCLADYGCLPEEDEIALIHDLELLSSEIEIIRTDLLNRIDYFSLVNNPV